MRRAPGGLRFPRCGRGSVPGFAGHRASATLAKARAADGPGRGGQSAPFHTSRDPSDVTVETPCYASLRAYQAITWPGGRIFSGWLGATFPASSGAAGFPVRSGSTWCWSRWGFIYEMLREDVDVPAKHRYPIGGAEPRRASGS
ncbi:hypothetical protein GCM10010425_50300 [Streptomyces spororaveus]|uniref:Uncharacterized protein n=1 Tax=Streptomyces spororaveus TaxID=284039 RepID=A0ABQ3T2K6_9ACTN|nr:hypothetical protein Sspor_01850 [Streptomyces spororaveus]